jgi:homoserine acetyltransferase
MFATEHLSLSKSNLIEIQTTRNLQVESWLNYHGEKLEKRFQLSAYKMMNQLLKRLTLLEIEIFRSVISKVEANIYIVGINSDLFYSKGE